MWEKHAEVTEDTLFWGRGEGGGGVLVYESGIYMYVPPRI